MEEFVFVEPGEAGREKIKYLSVRYRYLVIAPRILWKTFTTFLETKKITGGVYYYHKEKGSLIRTSNLDELYLIGMIES